MENEVFLKAVSFAAKAHDGQIRKDGKTPYISHSFRTSLVLSQIFSVTNASMLAAAILHDTIEDTDNDFDDIKDSFGEQVAVWVGLLSKDKRNPKPVREKVYLDQLRQAPDEVKLIKLADAYDNIIDSGTANSFTHSNKTLERSRKYVEAFGKTDNVELSRAISLVEALVATKSRDEKGGDSNERRR